MEDTALSMVKEKLKKMLCDVIYHNQLDPSVMTEDAVWYANSEILHLEKKEVQYYLEHTLVNGADDEPEITFADISYVGKDCISLMGSVSWYTSSQRRILNKLVFHANWLQLQEEWRLKRLFTQRTKEFIEDNEITETADNMNDRKMLQQFPT